MQKFIYTLLLFLFAFMSNSFAYEFNKVNEFYDTLEANYSNTTDFKKVSLSSFTAINHFDKNFKLYNSDTKAFLYYKNNLIQSFDFPQNGNSSVWKNTLIDILDTYSKHSLNFRGNEEIFEQNIIKTIAQNIDKYSRIDNNTVPKDALYYEINNNVIYISSNSFYLGYANDIKRIVKNNKNAEGLILDFRNNKGGSFNEAIKLSDLFLDNALIAYSIENNEKRYYTSTKGDIFDNKKIIILVNDKTASAAEIVVAALRDQTRAMIVGTKTYGKGSIQTVHNTQNFNLFVTTGYTYSPAGKLIDKKGIMPQICTGLYDSCVIADNRDYKKDIMFAIKLIKNKLG